MKRKIPQADVEHLIRIGFCQQKFYKPHVWRKAKGIMEWLCDNTKCVVRYNFGRGKGKYLTTSAIADVPYDSIICVLAEKYMNQRKTV